MSFADAIDSTTVSVMNRSARVRADGSWRIENVPTNRGPIRVRATSVQNGITRTGQTEFINLVPGWPNAIGKFNFDNPAQIPAKLSLSTPTFTLTGIGQTAQINVVATYPAGTSKDVTPAAEGTSISISNPSIATLDQAGLVTAVSSGVVLVSAENEGAVGILRIKVVLAGTDSDGDGLPDDLEIANGMNPNDPVDALEDTDRDGLSNLEELTVTGTNRLLKDTDGEGISDGDEVFGKLGKPTDPLLADTDGDQINDKLEFEAGTDPTNPSSFNLSSLLIDFSVSPDRFVMNVNDLARDTVARRLSVIGTLRDGSKVNLSSSTRGTQYASSDLLVANFGFPDGTIYAGNDGNAIITITNGSWSATAEVTVISSSPQLLGGVVIPGFANNVEAVGDYAYVAAGAAGLQIVDVSDKSTPVVVGALDTPGNANDVRVVGNYAYVADGVNGLQIISVENPQAPILVGSVDTPGLAYDVVVSGGLCFVADGISGLQIVDVGDPASPRIIGEYPIRGEAVGVDITGQYAVLAKGLSGIEVISVANPAVPQGRGVLNYGGNARDLAMVGNTAYVADLLSGLVAVSVQNPRSPQFMGATAMSNSQKLTDVAVGDRFVFGAPTDLGRLLPITDLNNFFGATLPAVNLGTLAPPPYYGTGVSVYNQDVFITGTKTDAEHGDNGLSRMDIVRYASPVDALGQPPSVKIDTTATVSQVLQGRNFTVRVSATDDVGVANVQLFANDVLVGTSLNARCDFTVSAPAQPGQLILTAKANDVGANQGVSSSVLVDVIPDLGTTAVGRVVDGNGDPVADAAIEIFGKFGGLTNTAGEFLYTGIPSVKGDFFVRAIKTNGPSLLVGLSPAFGPNINGTVDVGTLSLPGPQSPVVKVEKVLAGTQVISSESVRVKVTVPAGVSVASVSLAVDGVQYDQSTETESVFDFYYYVYQSSGQVTMTAIVTDNNGVAHTSVPLVLDVVPDPGMTITGRIVDADGLPLVNATARVYYSYYSPPTGADGSFTIANVPSILGDVEVLATWSENGQNQAKITEPSEAVPGGILDFGTIVLVPVQSLPE